MFPGVLHVLLGLGQLPGLQQQGVDGIGCIFDFFDARATGVHAELTIGRRIQHFFWIAKHGVCDAHLVQHPLDDAEIAQIGFEASDDIDLAVAAHLFAFHLVQREITQHAFFHVVPAGGMATDEAGGVGKGDGEIHRYPAILAGVGNEGI